MLSSFIVRDQDLSVTKTYIASIIFILVFVLVAVTGCETGKPSNASVQEIARLKKENARLKRQVRFLHQRANNVVSRRSRLVKPRLDEVRFDNSPSIGGKEARLALVEFSDYFCAFCKRFHRSTFDLIKKNYVDSGKLRYVYRDYPRGSSKQAVEAAVAANCAGEQGVYWEMQKLIFQNSPKLSKRFYRLTAKKMGLDKLKYNRCLKSDLQRNAVKRDYDYGLSLSIRGTPTFFIGRINGNKITSATRIVGAQPYSKFAGVIENYLESTKKR